MASLRTRTRTDGTEAYTLLYRRNGKQSSLTFHDFASASRYCDLFNKFGTENALEALAAEITMTSMTVGQWVERHIDHLTGVDLNTVAKYRAYLRNDVAPAFGELPLAALTRDHIARWINSMQEPDEHGWTPKAKTIKNKHGFLAGALKAAVPEHIAANPCDGIRLPRDDEAHEMMFLTRGEFGHLLACVTEPWRPLVEFLVASGARWSEATALRPGDVDRKAGTVRITRAWKQGPGGYRLGPPKTSKSRRTINVAEAVLDTLDYTHEYLFVNRDSGPVRSQGFSRRVWTPALKRAWPSENKNGDPVAIPILRPRIHDLRHTCASWLIHAGVPLPVIQQHLGHESIQTTVDRYGHLDRTSMAAVANAIGEVLAGD